MYTISKEVQFDAGHRVPNHKSKCRSPHGHRYRVVAYLEASDVIHTAGASDEGMLQDFSDLKELMTEHIHDVLDHSFIIYSLDEPIRNMFDLVANHEFKKVIFPYIPTAENIARWCFEQLVPFYDQRHTAGCLTLSRIDVYETPTSLATYDGEG